MKQTTISSSKPKFNLGAKAISLLFLFFFLLLGFTQPLYAQDSDNDSIPDDIDMDDDNDGILDKIECPSNLIDFVENGTFGSGDDDYGPALSTAETQYTYSTELSQPGKYNIIKNTDIVDYFDCCNVDVFRTVQDRTDPGNGYFAYFDMGVEDRGDAILTASFDVEESTTYDISFWIAGPFKHIPNSVGRVGIEIDGNLVETATIQDDTDWIFYTYTYTTPPGTTNILLEFINNSTGGNHGSDFAIDDIYIGVTDFTCLDTDADGIPDYLDLDSDNDGCPDYIEGGAGFDFDDGVAAQGGLSDGNGGEVTENLGVVIGSTPGVDLGVPVIAGEGQSEGDSIDDLINTCWELPIGTISGNVGEDTNNDDVSNVGIDNVVMELYDSNGDFADLTVTDANGDYIFENLVADTYTIIQNQPVDLIDVSEGDDTPDASDATGPNDVIDNILIASILPGEHDSGNNFVEEQICANWVQALANSELSVGVVSSPGLVGSYSDLVNITYFAINTSSEPIRNVELNTEVLYYSGLPTGIVLSPTFSGDPNNNGQLDPNEVWFYSEVQTFEFDQGDSFVITGSAIGDASCGEEIGAAASLLFTSGINMDVNIEQTHAKPGDQIDVSLITRLLIDEDAAIQPKEQLINVGGVPVKTALKATQWEARDLMISATGLNGGLAFDPFNPPAGLELTNFCAQGGLDSGRNSDYVLDEYESIETVRAPCESFGQDDVLCEYPDWVFNYTLTIPHDFTGENFTVSATDDFSVWKAEETMSGSGKFGEFLNVTSLIESGGTDSESVTIQHLTNANDLNVDINIDQIRLYPNPVADFLQIEITESMTQLIVKVYDLNGKKVLESQITQDGQIDLSQVLDGLYLVKVFDSKNEQIGCQQITKIR